MLVGFVYLCKVIQTLIHSMKFHTFFLAAAFLAPSLLASEVKEIELNNGTIYKACSISEETPEHYILSVPAGEGKSIRVEKKVIKTDVKRIVLPTKEEIDFKRLQRTFPTEEMVTEAVEADFQASVDRFLKKYPNSPNKLEIDKQVALVKAAVAHLSAGDVLIDGKWMPKSVQERIAYTMHSKKILSAMVSRLTSGDYKTVLNLYDRMAKEFPMSAAFSDAVKVARKTGLLYEKQLDDLSKRARSEYDATQAKIRKLQPDEAAKVRAIDNKSRDEFRDRIQAERAAGMRYTSYNPKDYTSIDSSKSAVSNFNSLLKRDAKGSSEPGEHDGKADSYFEKFWGAIDAGDIKVARESMGLLNSARVPENYKEAARTAYNALQKKTDDEMRAKQAAEAAERKAAAEKKAAEDKARREKAEKMKMENIRKSREAAAAREAARKGEKTSEKKGVSAPVDNEWK